MGFGAYLDARVALLNASQDTPCFCVHCLQYTVITTEGHSVLQRYGLQREELISVGVGLKVALNGQVFGV